MRIEEAGGGTKQENVLKFARNNDDGSEEFVAIGSLKRPRGGHIAMRVPGEETLCSKSTTRGCRCLVRLTYAWEWSFSAFAMSVGGYNNTLGFILILISS